jgi:acetyl-CoA acetyltransferase
MTRYPIKDQVAFASAVTTEFSKSGNDRSQTAMAVDACTKAVVAAGLRAADIDGICGTAPEARAIQSALGIPELTWWQNPPLVGSFVPVVLEAMQAVFAGACSTVLAYHAAYRLPWQSRAAAADPFRLLAGQALGMLGNADPESVNASAAYTAWASRYLHEFGRTREDLGLVAINNRSNAMANPHAVLREPLSMEQYLDGRMIRWPLCIYDMDVPVDGADAFVITTAERARDLRRTPVLIHAAASGMIDKNDEDQLPGLDRHGQQVVVKALRDRSDLWLDDVDLYYPYDGFSFLTLAWIENAGWCGPGEAPDFLRAHWVKEEQRVRINGRVLVNSHGGSLSEGGTQGSGHIREAVMQLQGTAGEHQVQDATTALLTPGGFFFNSHGLILTTG